MVKAYANHAFIGVLYLTTLHTPQSKDLLEAALTSFLAITEDGSGKALYKWYYEHQAPSVDASSLDLAFNDDILHTVEEQWAAIAGTEAAGEQFLKFEERNALGEDDDERGEDY